MKKLIKKEWYLSPLLFNARERLIKENTIKSLNELSKEIGLSINTIQKIKRKEIVAKESVVKLLDWSDTKADKTPITELVNWNADGSTKERK